MSKIEELKVQIETEKEAKKNYNEAHARRVQKLKEELAALEAENVRPRQWGMYLTQGGYLSSSPTEFVWGARCHEGLNRNTPITVIEKKPVRVTKALANKCWDTRSNLSIGYGANTPQAIAEILKAAGIDAIAAD